MPLFSLLSLFFALIVESNSTLQKVLMNDACLYAGLGIAILAITGNFFKKMPEMLSYDLFSSGTLTAWFTWWKPLFNPDSPIFFFFPVYFALISALASLIFMSRRHKIDAQELKLLRAIEGSGAVASWMLMSVVLATLYFENHFLQYPVWMTLLIIRYLMSGFLQYASEPTKPDSRKLLR